MDARTGQVTGVRTDADLRRSQWLALAVPGGLLLGALGSEYVGGLVPCEMCLWQRWPHLAAVALAALSFLAARQARALVLLAALAIAVSGAIGVFHAGVEYGWWQGLTSCSSTVSGGSPDELLKSILATPLVRCDQVQWSLLGISLAGWNAIVSFAGVAAILLGLRRR